MIKLFWVAFCIALFWLSESGVAYLNYRDGERYMREQGERRMTEDFAVFQIEAEFQPEILRFESYGDSVAIGTNR